MKKFIYIFLTILSLEIILAQQASDYFPENPEVRWEYKATVLDSLNNQIDSLTYYRHDLFFNEAIFEGKLAKIVKTKSGPKETIQFQPYIDSLFFHFSGSDGYEYFKLGIIKNVILLIDSLISDSTFSVLSLFQSLEQWYNVYRFAQSLGDEYTILQIDTTVTIGSETIPLRLEYLGERYPDETITTAIGDFECKKFARKIGVSYVIYLPPPLPPLVVPILFLEDYVWITENYWIVKGLIPSTNVDLQIINIDPFYIPGLVTKLDAIFFDTTSSVVDYFVPNEITLEQNYPNPFNPSTTIKFTLPSPGNTSLIIYNALGAEVDVLLDNEMNAGTHEIEFNISSLSGSVSAKGGYASGVYFYQLRTDGFVETKKMILLK
jgi:hypothetical protein